VAGLSERVAEPFETFVKTITRCSASRLNVPGSLSQRVKTKFVGDFGGVHGVRKILLVGEDQEKSITQFILVQHALQFLPSFDHTISIVGVNDEDDALGVLEVVSPERSNLVLTTNIPHGELNVLVFDSLNVEANGRDSGDNFTQLELVQDGGLSGSVETNHQNTHLLLSPQPIEEFRECETHVGGVGLGVLDVVGGWWLW